VLRAAVKKEKTDKKTAHSALQLHGPKRTPSGGQPAKRTGDGWTASYFAIAKLERAQTQLSRPSFTHRVRNQLQDFEVRDLN